MPVTVRTGAALKSLFGGRQQTEADGATVGALLDQLGVRDRICDGDGNVRRHFNIHVNEGEDIRLQQGLDTPVSDGDTVTILSAIAGGEPDTARKLWLTFPRELVGRPLIWEIGKRFDVVTNIRQASVADDVGLVGLEICGAEDTVEEAIQFLAREGVDVEPIELGVVE
jgi:molybdopterin converting factor small subunit